MKLFLQKDAKFSSAGAPPPDSLPHCEFLATRLIGYKKVYQGHGEGAEGPYQRQEKCLLGLELRNSFLGIDFLNSLLDCLFSFIFIFQSRECDGTLHANPHPLQFQVSN